MQREEGSLQDQLLGALGRLAVEAPANTLPEVDELKRDAERLQAAYETLEAQVIVANAEVASLQSELDARHETMEFMGFDSLYAAAEVAFGHWPIVRTSAILKAGERALWSESAILARHRTKTTYVGRSQSMSFPIGHTGIRYRVG